MEVSGKASDNKSIAAMPDVCMSPPSPPAGPVPIPYPNTAMASDSADGTKTVTIGGKEVGMKNSSTYSKSTGDEPATQSFGANVGSHKIQGPMKFAAWSSDVKFEGANAIRMGDMTTHNHSNPGGVASLTASVAGVAVVPPGNCEELAARNKEARTKMTSQRKKGTKGIRKVGTGTTTITHGVVSAGGASVSIRACSRALVQKFDGGFVKGRNIGQKGGYTTVCGKPFKYRKGGIPKSRHTEAKILDTIQKALSPVPPPKLSLTMAINWNNSRTPEDACEDCTRMICAAMECIDIKLCKKGEPVKPTCDES
jgi:hypothetical protein